MEKTILKISEIKNNPNNPRLIKDENFKKLVKSLKDFPIMANKLRKVVVDENNIILGGNMRFKAIKEAGMKEVHVEYFTRDDAEENNRLAKELDPTHIDKTYEEQCKEFIIKDNVSGGEWDWDIVANEWGEEDLEAWGVDLPLPKGAVIDGEISFSEELNESHNYVVLYFDNDVDWLQLLSIYPLKSVKALDSKSGFEKIGIGRVVNGKEFINEILK